MHLYKLSVEYAIAVGQRVAQFIKFLKDQNATGELSEMHLIGYSLGAHVAGNFTLLTIYYLKLKLTSQMFQIKHKYE